jgi:predicted transcriptional regulator
VKRTQIYIEDEQDRLLADRAADLQRTKSELIRDAIDRYLGRNGANDDERTSRWRAAVEASFGVAPELPDGTTIVTRMRRADAERLRSG